MSPSVEFFFDYGSPYSYLANGLLPGLRERTGAEIVYRPMLLGGVFKATGNHSPALESVAAKRSYGGAAMRRWVEHYGADFQGNPHFPINTLALMRMSVAAQQAGAFDAYHAAIHPAFWAEGRNLGDPDEVARVLDAAGLDSKHLAALGGEPAAKDELRANTDEAVARGAFGAPTFFLGDEMYFGADHVMFLEKALTR